MVWLSFFLLLPQSALTEARTTAAYIIFLASYVVFALGKFPGLKIDRTGAAIIGAVGMVAFGMVRAGEALHYIDFSTVVLLFSMMLIVGTLRLADFLSGLPRWCCVTSSPHTCCRR